MNEEIKKSENVSCKIDELNKLKVEVKNSFEETKKEKKKLSWDSTVVTAILVVLVSLSIFQSLESKAILDKVNSGNLKSGPASSAPASALPSSLEDLPDMVGGC